MIDIIQIIHLVIQPSIPSILANTFLWKYPPVSSNIASWIHHEQFNDVPSEPNLDLWWIFPWFSNVFHLFPSIGDRLMEPMEPRRILQVSWGRSRQRCRKHLFWVETVAPIQPKKSKKKNIFLTTVASRMFTSINYISPKRSWNWRDSYAGPPIAAWRRHADAGGRFWVSDSGFSQSSMLCCKAKTHLFGGSPIYGNSHVFFVSFWSLILCTHTLLGCLKF